MADDLANNSQRGATEVSVVIPVYNEDANIRLLWEALVPVLDACSSSWETIWIDDGSDDNSIHELRTLRGSDPRVRVIRLNRNRGQSTAFWCGFRHACGGVVVTIDADLQNDPRDIPALLDAVKTCDMAIGWRKQRHDRFSKRAASKLANRFRNWLTGESVPDIGCSLKAFHRPIVEHMFPFDGMHRFYPTLAGLAGFRVTVVPVRHHHRLHGKSKYGIWNRLLRPLSDCLAVWWMKRRYIGTIECEEISDD
jgi:glycosyltransferase involved in cell wall biosynthesis